MRQDFCDGRIALFGDDCLCVLADMEPDSVDAVVTDPPYHLTSIVKRFGGTSAANDTQTSQRVRDRSDGYARAASGFMGKQWDGGDIAFRPETWAAVMRVLKPGGHLVAFAAPKNAHRLICAIEDAGFEIRDTLMWLFGTGFPKSHDISKAIDKAAGVERTEFHQYIAPDGKARGLDLGIQGGKFAAGESNYQAEKLVSVPATDEARQWAGWGTALKPAYEPICLARKPLIGTVAANVLAHGVGGLNIDATRIGTGEVRQSSTGGMARKANPVYGQFARTEVETIETTLGRWPANIVHDDSDEVLAAFPDARGQIARASTSQDTRKNQNCYGAMQRGSDAGDPRSDSGSAARFFYSAKASKADRIGSKHPTVKPVALMRWLVRMVCPPGGLILDPFAGTGTTGAAAISEGMNAILIEREEEYQLDIIKRFNPEPVAEAALA